MLIIAVFAILVAACSAGGARGPVEGIVPCGSKGEILEVRLTDCTTRPCQLTIGSTYNIEVDFIPSLAHKVFTVLVSVIRGGSEDEVVHVDLSSPTSPGGAFTLTNPLKVGENVGTGMKALRTQIKGDNGDTVEFCGLAVVNVSE